MKININSSNHFKWDANWIFFLLKFNKLATRKALNVEGYRALLKFCTNFKHLQRWSVKEELNGSKLLALISLFFIFPIKRNAQISKATTYKWPYNSKFIFCSYFEGFQSTSRRFFLLLRLHFVPWTFAVKLHSEKKQTNKKKINQFVFFVLVQLKKFCHDLRVWTAPCCCSRGITVRTYNKKRNKPLHSFVVM